MAQTDQAPPWRNNSTFVYTGEIYDADGILSFREDIQDKALLHVGTVANVLNDTQASTPTENSIDLGQGGWFPFELRISNNNGAAGQVTAPGFGLDPEGGTDYVAPENSDAHTMDLFRYLSRPADTLDTSIEGEYLMTLTATDAAGNTATETRTVIVRDDLTLPIITLAGDPEIILQAGTPYTDPGFTVANRVGTTYDPAEVVEDSHQVDTAALGIYTITYNFNKDGKIAPTVSRKVRVIDTTALITLTNGEKVRLDVGTDFTDPGYTVTDNLDATPSVEVRFIASGVQPIAHWTFDETDGTTATELMNSLNGTLINFPDPVADSWVPEGKYSNALSFNSANSSYLTVPGSALLDLTVFTISFWMKTDDYKRDMFVFEKTTDNTINSQYNVFFEAASDQIFFRANDGAFGNFEQTTVGTLGNFTADTWQHVAVVYTGTHQLVYVNGAMQANVQKDVTVPATPAAGPAYIGAFSPAMAIISTVSSTTLKSTPRKSAMPKSQTSRKRPASTPVLKTNSPLQILLHQHRFPRQHHPLPRNCHLQ